MSTRWAFYLAMIVTLCQFYLGFLLTMRTSQVCQEFMDLKIPRHAEILDVAAGSGILSAEIQTGGYEERVKISIQFYLDPGTTILTPWTPTCLHFRGFKHLGSTGTTSAGELNT